MTTGWPSDHRAAPTEPPWWRTASEVTYAELEAESTWVARRLAAYGVRRGSVAALTMEPRREQVVLLHALMKVGAVLLPLSPRFSAEERAAVIAAEEPTSTSAIPAS